MVDTLEWFAADGTPYDLGCDGKLADGVSGRFAPPAVYSEMVVPNQPGAVLTNIRHDVREVDVPFIIQVDCASAAVTGSGAPAVALRTAVRSMARLLDPMRGDGYLLSTAPDGVQRKLVCRCMAGPQMTEKRGDTHLETMLAFLLVFRTTDTFPYWRDLVATTVTWAMPVGDAFFPIFPLAFAESTLNEDPATITVAGDVAVWPVWAVTGPFSGVRLTLGSTVFELVYDAQPGDVVTIDTEAKTVLLNGVTDLFASVTQPFLFQLQSGANTVEIVVMDGGTGTQVELAYHDGWLSV